MYLFIDFKNLLFVKKEFLVYYFLDCYIKYLFSSCFLLVCIFLGIKYKNIKLIIDYGIDLVYYCGFLISLIKEKSYIS